MESNAWWITTLIAVGFYTLLALINLAIKLNKNFKK